MFTRSLLTLGTSLFITMSCVALADEQPINEPPPPPAASEPAAEAVNPNTDPSTLPPNCKCHTQNVSWGQHMNSISWHQGKASWHCTPNSWPKNNPTLDPVNEDSRLTDIQGQNCRCHIAAQSWRTHFSTMSWHLQNQSWQICQGSDCKSGTGYVPPAVVPLVPRVVPVTPVRPVHSDRRSWHSTQRSWHAVNRSWHTVKDSRHAVNRSWHSSQRSWHDVRRSQRVTDRPMHNNYRSVYINRVPPMHGMHISRMRHNPDRFVPHDRPRFRDGVNVHINVRPGDGHRQRDHGPIQRHINVYKP